MSSFIGTASMSGGTFTGAGMLSASNEQACPSFYVWNGCGRMALSPWQDAVLWPTARFGGSDNTGMIFGLDNTTTGRWGVDNSQDDSGGQQCKKIIGTTRNSSGAVLGSCIVQGFVTATDVFAGQVTSDTGGYFELCTPYTGNHYLVAYKAGSPDVSGSTINTLVPA